MTQYSVIPVMLLSVLLAAFSACAGENETDLPAHCLTEEESWINVQLQAIDKDPAIARGKVRSSIQDIQSLAKTSGMTRMDAGGIGYSATSHEENGETLYQVHGNVNFHTSPPEKALDLLTAMQNKGYPATLSFTLTNGVTHNVSNKCRLITATGKWQ